VHLHLPAIYAYADTNTYGYYDADAEAICDAQISPYSATASVVNKVAASNQPMKPISP